MKLLIDRVLLILDENCNGRLCVGQEGSQSTAVLGGLVMELDDHPLTGQLALVLTFGGRAYTTRLELPRAVASDIREWMQATQEAREGKQPEFLQQ